MTWGVELALFFAILMGLLFTGMWVPFAIAGAAMLALILHGGWESLRGLGLVTWGTLSSFTLTALPLFMLMASVISHSGVSKRFYDGCAVLIRRLPGGLLQTNILGCAVFAAISGSSMATSASIGTVALTQLEQKKYDRKMTLGSLAAGGTLGILIPPSITMIIYGSITETSIAKLFMAGVVPGILLAIIYMFYIAIRCKIQPKLAPAEREPKSWTEVLRAIVGLLPFIWLMVAVLGGIYLGVTTPTEAAAVGSTLAIIICVIWGNLTWTVFKDALIETVKVSVPLLFIVLAAFIFSFAVEMAGIGSAMVGFLKSFGFSKTQFLLALLVMYALLGCVMDGAAMLVLTIPLLQPVLVDFGIDLVWFGVFMVLMLELGMITPPFGLNLFVMQSISKSNIELIVAGVIPYYFIIVGYALFLMTFPRIALWLPARM